MLMLSGSQQEQQNVTPVSFFPYLLITIMNHNTPAVKRNDNTVC